MVKNLPAVRETWFQSLGWEDPLKEGMATCSGILSWRIPMDRRAWWATVHGVAKSWTQLSTQHILCWEGDKKVGTLTIRMGREPVSPFQKANGQDLPIF